MKAQAAQIEPWNHSAEVEAEALDEPRIWFLLAPIEVKALVGRRCPHESQAAVEDIGSGSPGGTTVTVQQAAEHICARCGLRSPVVPLSPWEFRYGCPCQQEAGVISWAHANEPPLFHAEARTRPPTQMEIHF